MDFNEEELCIIRSALLTASIFCEQLEKNLNTNRILASSLKKDRLHYLILYDKIPNPDN
jgi:hypothetical protein